MIFKIVSSAVQNSNTRERRSPNTPIGGSGGGRVRDNHCYMALPPFFPYKSVTYITA